MRNMHLVAILLLSAVAASSTFGDAPATQPSLVGLSPKQTLSAWSQRATSATVDDMVETMSFLSPKEKQYATVIAEQEIMTGKLQKAVGAKWGKAAENAALQACMTDTQQDDETAAEKVTGDHATVVFKREELAPVPFVRLNGVWKLDVAAFVAQAQGFTIDQLIVYLHRTTVVIAETTGSIEGGKYADIDSLSRDLAVRIANVPQE